MRARAAPCPGVLGPARTAPPPLRTRGGVPSPSPSPPEPLRTPAAMCHPFAELRAPSVRAQLATPFVPGLARVHAGAFWHRHRLRPDPFALSPWCVREGRRGQCVLYPRLRKGRQRARRRAQSGGKQGLARAGETVGAHCPSSTPLGGTGGAARKCGARQEGASGACEKVSKGGCENGGVGIPFHIPCLRRKSGVRRRDGACKRGQEGGAEGVLKEGGEGEKTINLQHVHLPKKGKFVFRSALPAPPPIPPFPLVARPSSFPQRVRGMDGEHPGPLFQCYATDYPPQTGPGGAMRQFAPPQSLRPTTSPRAARTPLLSSCAPGGGRHPKQLRTREKGRARAEPEWQTARGGTPSPVPLRAHNPSGARYKRGGELHAHGRGVHPFAELREWMAHRSGSAKGLGGDGDGDRTPPRARKGGGAVRAGPSTPGRGAARARTRFRTPAPSRLRQIPVL